MYHRGRREPDALLRRPAARGAPSRRDTTRPGRRRRPPLESAQDQHRRTGAGHDRGEPVGAQPVDELQRLGHGRAALLLVQVVAGGASAGAPARPPARPRAARCDRRPRRRRRAGPCPAAGPGRPRSTAGPAGRTPRPRPGRRRARRTAYHSSASRPEMTKPPYAAGRDVVGMPLEVRGQPEQRVVVEPLGAVRDQRPGQREAADDRRRGRAEAAGVRDRVAAGEPEPGAGTPSASNPARIARTTRWDSSRGTDVGAVRRSPRRPVRRAGTSASSSSRSSRARPRESKPGPRLAEVAGTSTRTGPVQRRPRVRPARRPRPRRSRRCRRRGRPADRRPPARSRCP